MNQRWKEVMALNDRFSSVTVTVMDGERCVYDPARCLLSSPVFSFAEDGWTGVVRNTETGQVLGDPLDGKVEFKRTGNKGYEIITPIIRGTPVTRKSFFQNEEWDETYELIYLAKY